MKRQLPDSPACFRLSADLIAGVSHRFRAANMEVPDWGTAPEEDYPLLLAPNSLPASDNARKKAKRKQKQQQEHLQNLIHAPVQLLSTTVPSGKQEVIRRHLLSLPTC